MVERRMIGGQLMNNDLERIWKEAVVARLKLLLIFP
jgi:hypothetical protein